jgi:hypothetical protein
MHAHMSVAGRTLRACCFSRHTPIRRHVQVMMSVTGTKMIPANFDPGYPSVSSSSHNGGDGEAEGGPLYTRALSCRW